MKKILILLIAIFFITFTNNCNKKENNAPNNKKAVNKIQKKGKKKLDIDKLDIPERMKKAIKEGKIPMDRVKQFLEMRKGDLPLVKIESVNKKKINSFLNSNGVVEPEKKVEVYSRLSAYVNKIIKEEGAFVKKDDILALLDDTEIKISYKQAKIQLKQSELSVKDETNNYKRNKELMKTNLISEKDFQTSEANYQKAKLEYENKLENYKNLELQLNYTKIKSPIQGYITERLIEIGSRVNPNQQVFTVEDFSPLLIKVYAPTSDIINLKKGMEAEVTTDVLKGYKFNGKIKLINPRIDVQSGTVKVTLEVFDSSMKLKPGMFVEVKILINNKNEALIIPIKSIIHKDDKSFVYIFKKMQVFKKEIKTGISEEDNIEVVEGLNEGDKIVTVGIEALKDKMRVKITR
jgi:membrane fusion protein (multidrug efflux system)